MKKVTVFSVTLLAACALVFFLADATAWAG